jgi:hypothetical protein
MFITLRDQSSFLYIFTRAAKGFVPVMISLIAAGKKLQLSVCFIQIILLHSVAAVLCILNLNSNFLTDYWKYLAHPPFHSAPTLHQAFSTYIGY